MDVNRPFADQVDLNRLTGRRIPVYTTPEMLEDMLIFCLLQEGLIDKYGNYNPEAATSGPQVRLFEKKDD